MATIKRRHITQIEIRQYRLGVTVEITRRFWNKRGKAESRKEYYVGERHLDRIKRYMAAVDKQGHGKLSHLYTTSTLITPEYMTLPV